MVTGTDLGMGPDLHLRLDPDMDPDMDMDTMATAAPALTLETTPTPDATRTPDATSTPDMGLDLALTLIPGVVPTPIAVLALTLDMAPAPGVARAPALARDWEERGGCTAEAGDWHTFAWAASWTLPRWNKLDRTYSEHILFDLLRLVTMSAA
jgi:hypothetical protein